MIIGTPKFMSPEQARGKTLTIKPTFSASPAIQMRKRVRSKRIFSSGFVRVSIIYCRTFPDYLADFE